MFTGIVQEIGTVEEILHTDTLMRYAVIFPHHLIAGLEKGASVSINGICQTVVEIDHETIWFEAIQETLRCTTLGSLKLYQSVNVERSLKFGEEIGGHLLSGHVSTTAPLLSIEGTTYTFGCSSEWIRYLFPKGFIAIDGVSLTLGEITPQSFTVHLIPETLRRTTLGSKQPSELVNLEFDNVTVTTVMTVERLLASYDPTTSMRALIGR